MSYRIQEVISRKDLRRFVRFPDELYRKCPQYVPALHADQVKSLTRAASLAYCRRKMWLAFDGERVVGRICAMINPRYNERYGKSRARFGWFDTIDNLEVARLLLSTAEAWAKAEGMTEIHGPLYYNTMGKQGMLVEGFESIPPFNCLYNFPYYVRLIEALGFEKECDWLQYNLVANHGVPEKARRLASLVAERYKVHVGSIERFKKDPEKIRQFFQVYNDSFASSVYNFIPFTEEEIQEEVRASIPFISDKTSCLLYDENEQLVAFGISFPSISKALQKARGHLFPFGWWHLWRAMHKYETLDLMVNGAAPEWQNRGVSAVYYKEMADRYKELGCRRAISNPQIESNSAVNIWNSYEREPFMRRRCYIKKID